MGAKQQTPMIALVAALAVGGFCIFWGVDVFLDSRKTDEFGVGAVPGGGWSVLWIGVAVALLSAGIVLTLRRATHKK